MSRGGRNRTLAKGFGDPCTTIIRRPQSYNIVACSTKNRELFALGMGGVLLAEAAVLRKGELFLHFLLVALGVVRNAPAGATLQFCHVVLDFSHTLPYKSDKSKAFPLYVKIRFSSIPNHFQLSHPYSERKNG